MKHMELIKRAWRITWRYRVLWIFGILLALTSGGGGGGGGGQNVISGGDDRWPSIPGLQVPEPGAIAGIVLLCCCILLVVVVVSIILQYVARAALYRAVDQIEETGVAPTWRQGFRLGWTHRAFRLFLLELIVGIAVILAALLLLAVAASPLLLLLVDSGVVKGIGIAMTVILALLWILALIVAAIVLSVLGQFWSREIVLADRGIGEALGSGYEMVRRRVRDVGVMWLLMFAIGLGLGIVMIPIALGVLAVAAGMGGGIGYALYAATESIPLAVLGGLPLFLVILIVPLSIIQGIYLVFESSVWTVTYREAAGRSKPTEAEPAPSPAVA